MLYLHHGLIRHKFERNPDTPYGSDTSLTENGSTKKEKPVDSGRVAEGRWSSDDPDLTVHFVPLGHDGVRVWVDVVKVSDAEVWRPSSYIECMEDALGSTIAWPKEKWQEQAEKAVIETLGLGRTTQHLLVRLLRYWEVFSVNNPLHFKGIVLLMIDEQKCHVKKKDIRKFLDGIYVSEKGKIAVEE
ncbi:unnamed protein product [Microthlaspi erraticum]|uniref:Transposase Tnp1/En/Spm-like domain-containing protein n=1 Tax=Microthlaspi erraticum TaxID=1685480 RepID=A0A6D2JBB6_9BRAS|nr:unnamed protein product [Microthlaspi erraticum]